MFKNFHSGLVFKLILAVLIFPALTFAQAFTSPLSDESVAACKDYFVDKWATPLDMEVTGPTYSPDKAIHGNLLFNIGTLINGVAGTESQQLSAYGYANGVVSMTTTGDTAYFRVLTPDVPGQIVEKNVTRFGGFAPLKASEYSLLTFRMYSSVDSFYQVAIDKEPGVAANFSGLIPTFKGWHTYQLDLNTLSGYSSSDNRGVAIFPARGTTGAEIKIDWIQLTRPEAACETFTASYTASSGDVVSLFLDTDTDPTNGVIERTDPVTGTTSAARDFDATMLYPGTYRVLGIKSSDYATHFGNAWNMSGADDIVEEVNQNISTSGDGFSGGQFCFQTTTTDPSFRLAAPTGAAINTNIFSLLSLEITGIGDNQIQVYPLDENGATIGSSPYVRTISTAGDGVYQVDIKRAKIGGEVGDSLPSSIGFLRIDPGIQSGRNVCVKWVSLGSAFTATEPVFPAPFVAGGDLIVENRSIAPFVQPDREGGRDYFAHVRGNPANFDSSSDIDRLFNVDDGTINPGNAYTDNIGSVRIGDYFEGQNTQTGTVNDADTHMFLVLRDDVNPIDATVFKNACLTMNVHSLGATTDHTVLRLGWESTSAFTGYTSDDIILKTVGEARYCFNMSGLPIETVAGDTVEGDFWTDVKSYRIDPHEISALAPYRINDARLAAHHEADQAYAVVIGGDRDAEVQVFKNTSRSTSGGTLIGSLPVNRDSDVLVWDTSAETDGTYFLYSVIGNNRFLADAPVVINHSFPDALQNQAPILSIQAPAADGSGRYDSLDVAGHALDNVRLAVIEVLIDGELVSTFLPDLFLKDVRDASPAFPYNSSAGFQKSLSLDGFADGPHTVIIKAWDTEGNSTVYNAGFTKASDNLTAPVVFPVPDEASIPVEAVNPDLGANLAMTSRIQNRKRIIFSLTGAVPGSTVRIKYANSEAGVSSSTNFVYQDLVTDSDFEVAVNVKKKLVVSRTKLRKTKRFCRKAVNTSKTRCLVSLTTGFFAADSGDGTLQTSVLKINPRKIKAKKKVKSLNKWLNSVKLKGQRQ